MIANSEYKPISFLINQNIINQVKHFASKLNVSQDIIVSLAIKSFMDRYEKEHDILDRINKANQSFDKHEKVLLDHMKQVHNEILQEEQW